VALDEKPIKDSQRVLIAVAARVENQNMGWNADRTSVGNAWGTGPTLAEVVPLTVTLPGSDWTLRALDGKGAPTLSIQGAASARGSAFAMNAAPSLWYVATR
jgi:hypothetical protein